MKYKREVAQARVINGNPGPMLDKKFFLNLIVLLLFF